VASAAAKHQTNHHDKPMARKNQKKEPKKESPRSGELINSKELRKFNNNRRSAADGEVPLAKMARTTESLINAEENNVITADALRNEWAKRATWEAAPASGDSDSGSASSRSAQTQEEMASHQVRAALDLIEALMRPKEVVRGPKPSNCSVVPGQITVHGDKNGSHHLSFTEVSAAGPVRNTSCSRPSRCTAATRPHWSSSLALTLQDLKEQARASPCMQYINSLTYTRETSFWFNPDCLQ
jgi:hypothetical protein